MSADTAINVQDVIKSYGSTVILNRLSMNVERGIIYGLLGASGCGKTSLLSCIVGRKSIQSGDIWVLGGRPGEKESGSKIGYMPQELALIEEFTVKDAMYYFGTIFKMKPKAIDEQLDYLTKLLELPSSNKLLKHCSGGQRRRISFAVALVHSPQLLILDEPTVGVDPMLREKIWDHLRNLVVQQKITVIITTHYIEETKDANKIGLMRGGKLLIEDSPQKLLQTFQKDTLEEVFLILSQKQNKQMHEDHNAMLNEPSAHSTSTSSTESFMIGCGSGDNLTTSQERKQKNDQSSYMSATELDKHRLKALLTKNWKQFYRNTGGILFLLTFPLCQMWFFTNSLGTDPINLQLGIINDESRTTLCHDFNWNETIYYSNGTCHYENLACRFLTYLEHPMIHKVLFDSFEGAMQAVKHGHVIGFLHVPTNFSKTYERRINLGANAEEWVTNYGEIKAYLDMSNKLTGAKLAAKLQEVFIEFQKKMFKDCNMSEKLGEIPIRQYFVHGDDRRPLTGSMTPGMALVLTYLLGFTMTSDIIVKEKMEGVWERSIIAGVSSLEITVSHLLLECCIVFVECIEILIMVCLVPSLNIVGNVGILFLILYLQGICGMSFGFLVSAVCKSPSECQVMGTGSYLLVIIISGIIWPIEAMPVVLRYISLSSPCTLAILAFRNVMDKGWSLWNLQVINGVAVLITWTLVFGVMSVLVIKIKR